MILHLLLLHSVGTTSLINDEVNINGKKFFPYFYLKDLNILIFFLFIILFLILFVPNLLGHSDNYIKATALVTPIHIVPE
jgi:ubiquinol-cytochrome c reductase cytochrome b subunit